MRVVHVMDHSLPKGDGYAIRAKYLLEAQATAGHQVTVLTSPSQGADAVAMQAGGVDYRRSHYTASELTLVKRGGKHLVFGRAIRRALGQLLAEQPYDIIHAHTPFTVARVALAEARRLGLPLVYEKRNLWEESAAARGKISGRFPFYQLSRAVDRRVTREADCVCTLTEALKQHTIELGAARDRIVVVGNGVDTDAFRERTAPAELRAQCTRGGRFVIGFIGSFFSFEGIPLLVEAFARVRQNHPDARLVLVGDGEDKTRVDQLARELSLDASCWIVGRIPHAKVDDFCASMDVLVYPRYRSKLTEMISPLKPLEPMAMKRCVIASDVGGLRELISHGETGLLFEAGSAASLQDRLESLLSGQVDAAALGSRARDYVIAHRQWRQMAGRYDDAYRIARAARPAG